MPEEDPRPTAHVSKADGFDGPEVDIQFTYQYPEVSVDTKARTATHDPIGEDTVVQHLGRGDTKLSIKGYCYIDTANEIDKLTADERVRVRTDRFVGTAIIHSTSTDPEGAIGGKDMGTDVSGRKHNWVYSYRLKAEGATGSISGPNVPAPDSDRELSSIATERVREDFSD